MIGIHDFIERFEHEIDFEKKAKSIAKERGMSKEDVLKEWEEKKELGKRIHNKIAKREQLKNPGCYFGEYVPCETFDYSNLDVKDNILKEGIYLEKPIFSKKYKLISILDKIEIKRGKIYIEDYKTWNTIRRSSGYTAPNGFKIPSQKMLAPLSHLDQCVSGNTNLLTRAGIEYIKDTIGREVEIWNGKNWSKVKPFITGENKELFRVTFSDGSYLDVTNNHIFLVKSRYGKKFKELNTDEIFELIKTQKTPIYVPRANINYNEGINIETAYDYGFILGDGTVDRNVVKAGLYNEDKKIIFKNYERINNYTDRTVVYFKTDVNFCRKLKYENGLPREIFSWSKKSILDFIAGWADADGSLTPKGIRIYGKEDKIRDLQLLLTKCNINASCNLMQEAGIKTNITIRRNAIWYVQISKTIDIPTQRLKSNYPKESTKKGKNQIIRKIEKIDGLHTTYCLTESNLNQCVFNNILTKQCNFNHACLQLSLGMAIIWENNPRLKPESLLIRHITVGKNDSITNEELIEVPYLREEVEILFKYIRANGEDF